MLIYFVILLCVVIIFYSVCKILDPTLTITDALEKLGKTFKRNIVVPHITPLEIYAGRQVDYKNFASIMWNCLMQVGARCKLSVPGRLDGIYCLEVIDRVKIDGGIYTFCYEVGRAEPSYGGGLNKAPVVAVTDIERILSNNLSGHLRGGYCYNGKIHVWEREHDTVLIEVHAVGRIYQAEGGVNI